MIDNLAIEVDDTLVEIRGIWDDPHADKRNPLVLLVNVYISALILAGCIAGILRVCLTGR